MTTEALAHVAHFRFIETGLPHTDVYGWSRPQQLAVIASLRLHGEEYRKLEAQIKKA